MNKNLSYTNYITGTELENGKILLYAGKTRNGIEQRKAGKMACGFNVSGGVGFDGRLFDTIHANSGTKNDKLTEQKHINTVRAVAQLLPDVIVSGNTNDDGFYGGTFRPSVPPSTTRL